MALLSVFLLEDAEANCNLIPAAEKTFPSTLGGVTTPIVAPGQPVEIRLTGCDASPGFSSPASSNTVTITFEPPGGGGNTAVVVPALPDHLCAAGTMNVGQSCTNDSDCGACVDCCLDSVADCAAGSGPCNVLRFAVPDTDADLPLAGDGLGLAGPASVAVTSGFGTAATIGPLNQPTRGCDKQPETTFKQFTILPAPNDFAALASGAATQLRMTVDGDNSIVIPLLYRNVLPEPPGSPVAIFLDGTSSFAAFSSNPGVGITAALASRANPSDFVSSFTLEGRPLPPLLRVADNGKIYGTADGVSGIIRIARDADGMGDLFDVTDRLYAGKGPVVIDKMTDGFAINTEDAAPLAGLTSTSQVVGFARQDGIVEVLDATTGVQVNTGKHTTDAGSIQASGDLVAFLQSEAADGDINGDGDTDDNILRVYDAAGTDLTSALEPVADPTTLMKGSDHVGGGSHDISGSLVFYRAPHPQSGLSVIQAMFAEMLPSVLSPDGKFYYSRDPSDGTSGSGRVSARQFDDVRGVLIAAEGIAAFLDGGGPITMSGDGKHVYTGSYWPGLTGPPSIAAYSRDSGTGALTFVGTVQEGVGGISGLNGLQGLLVSPDGAHVYASSKDDSSLVVFARNATTGVLTFVEAEVVAPGPETSNPFEMSMSGDGAHLYVTDPANNRLLVFSRNAVTGHLTLVETQVNGVGGVTGLAGASGVRVSPEGTHVYVVGGGTSCISGSGSNAIAVFSRNPGTGALTFVEADVQGVGGVDGLVQSVSTVRLSQDGTRVYIAGALSVAEFDRNTSTGALTYIDSEKSETAYSGELLAGYGFGCSTSANGPQVGVLDVSPAGRVISGAYVFGDAAQLQVFDAGTHTLRAAAQTTAGVVAVAAGRAVLLDTERHQGTDRNGDGDTNDQVAMLYDGNTDTLVSLNRAAADAAISANIVALAVPEWQQGNPPVDLNGNGGFSNPYYDIALEVQALPIVGPAAPQNVGIGVRQLVGATDLCAGGTDDGKVCQSGNDCASPGLCRGVVVFYSGSIVKKGGDSTDVERLYVYRQSDGSVTEIPTAAVLPTGPIPFSFVPDVGVVGHLVAITAYEPGVYLGSAAVDLNGDGDTADAVMEIYDLSTGTLINTGQAVDNACLIPGCNFSPTRGELYSPSFKIRGDAVAFLTPEAFQGNTDLNGDGNATDVVMQVYDTRSRTAQVFPAKGAPSGDPFVNSFMGRSVLYTQETEATLGRDIDGDGLLNSTVVLVAGDQDEDGSFDSNDTCVQASNPTQSDIDGDGLGDNICDSTLYCEKFIPSSPPIAPTAAAACQKAIAQAGRVYMTKRTVAVKSCLNRIANGKVGGDPDALCRGGVVSGTNVPPTDRSTAKKLVNARKKVLSTVAAACSDTLTGQLAACAKTTMGVKQCLQAAYGASAIASTQIAYGAVGQISDTGTNNCQKVIGAATGAYLKKVLTAMQRCLDRRNAGTVSGNGQSLCLGSMSSAGVLAPTDAATARAVHAAETSLRNSIQKKCSAAQLSAINACGANAGAEGDCLSCTGWRRAVESLQSAYGPS